MSEPRPCPSCSRPNAPHRVACLYCGKSMPNPTAAPPPKRQRISRELDQALEKALRGGNLGQVEQVLGKIDAQGPETLKRPEPRLVLAFEQPAPTQEDPQALLAELQQQISLAAESWSQEPSEAREALERAGVSLRTLRTLAESLPEPAPIALPPIRLPIALIIDPPGDVDRAPELAQALGLDLASARMHARAAHPKIVMRSGNAADVAKRAAAYTAAMGRPARALETPELRAIGRPLTALRIGPQDWDLAAGGQWALEAGEIPANAGKAAPPPHFELAVPGEVIVALYRRSGDSVSKSGERRIHVTDLHGPDCFVRIVAGHCAMPQPGESALRAHRGWLDTLECRITGSRSCSPGEPPSPRDEGPLRATGWAQFEEHSRGSRLLYLGA